MAKNKKTGKVYESSLKASTEWKKTHIKQIKFDFLVDKDADVINAILTTLPNKTEYIRQLVREDIKRRQ